ncbi:MAG: serine hydrolase domain-containing protein [Limisphaerales bacterium]
MLTFLPLVLTGVPGNKRVKLRTIMRLAVKLSLILLTLCSLAPLNQANGSDLEQRIRSIQEKHSVMGLSVVGVRNGKVVSKTHLGWADYDRKIPVTDSSKFRIASISKTVAAAALMQLWEQGKFQLDDNISDYLGYPVVNPHFPKEPITFRHLLTHTSSLTDGPNYDQFLQLTYQTPDQALSLGELLSASGSHYKDGANFLKRAPGSHYHYSNLGFGLVGTLVEKISGERFDLYTEKNILKPLGLTATFNAHHLKNIDELGVLYRPGTNSWNATFDNHGGIRPPDRVGNSYVPGRNALVFGPQGGLRASAIDLSRFMAQFSHPKTCRILKPATARMMLDEHWTNAEQGSAYRGRGLGFQRTQTLVNGELWIGHSGSAYGLQSDMYFKEGGEIGIILITNGSRPSRSEGGFSQMEREILAAVIETLGKPRSQIPLSRR